VTRGVDRLDGIVTTSPTIVMCCLRHAGHDRGVSRSAGSDVSEGAGQGGWSALVDACYAVRDREQLDVLIACGSEVAVERRGGEARARQLVSLGRRGAVAAQLRSMVERAGRAMAEVARVPSAWTTDVRAEEIDRSRVELLALCERLRMADTPAARGVAMSLLLVRHARSPLYVAYFPGDVSLAAEAANRGLDPAEPSPEDAASPPTEPVALTDPYCGPAEWWWKLETRATSVLSELAMVSARRSSLFVAG